MSTDTDHHRQPSRPASSTRSRSSAPTPSAIALDATFEALDVDSLDLVELGQIVQEEYGVEIKGEDMPKLKTVGDAVDLIAERAVSVMQRRVVITGVGAVTPLGRRRRARCTSAGARATSASRTASARCDDFDARRSTCRASSSAAADRFTQLALAAGAEALDAGRLGRGRRRRTTPTASAASSAPASAASARCWTATTSCASRAPARVSPLVDPADDVQRRAGRPGDAPRPARPGLRDRRRPAPPAPTRSARPPARSPAGDCDAVRHRRLRGRAHAARHAAFALDGRAVRHAASRARSTPAATAS